MKHSRWLLVLFLVAGFAFTIPDADGFRERLFRQLVTWVQKLPQERCICILIVIIMRRGSRYGFVPI